MMPLSFVKKTFALALGCTIILSCEKNPVDNGGSADQWIAINSGLGSLYVQGIALDPQNNDVIYVATFGGVYRSTDGGERWHYRSNGINSEDISCIVVSPHNSNILMCGTWGKGVYKSIDAGATWVAKGEGLPNPRIHEVLFDPTDSDKIYLATAEKLLVSNDGGDTWDVCFSFGNVRSVAIHPDRPEVLFVGVEFHGIFRTENGGLDWQEKNEGLHQTEGYYDGPVDMVFDPVETQVVYAATEAVDLHKSEDSGETWVQKTDGLDWRKVREVVIVARDHESLYAATDRGVMRSSDGAESWTPMSEGLTEMNVRSIVVREDDPQILYVGTYGAGVFRYVRSK